jgi:hypothetical protein
MNDGQSEAKWGRNLEIYSWGIFILAVLVVISGPLMVTAGISVIGGTLASHLLFNVVWSLGALAAADWGRQMQGKKGLF